MWSLGCILGEMLAGKPIFPGSSTVNQVEKIMATIPTPSNEGEKNLQEINTIYLIMLSFLDINTVCVSGIGLSMIKNSSSQRIPLHTILGPNVPSDAMDLINKLLVFNPEKRLTAEEALEHQYVSRFHDPSEEIEMSSSVVIPLNDDVRLSVDDYRNKLYEIMSNHASLQNKINLIKNSRSETIKPEGKSKVYRETEHHVKSSMHAVKEKPYSTTSEPRLIHCQAKQKQNFIVSKPEPKISKQYITFTDEKFSCPAKTNATIHDVPAKERGFRKKLNSKSNIYMSFNSYNPGHGIITQSALMELRAGTR